jgi:hypothetical protein
MMIVVMPASIRILNALIARPAPSEMLRAKTAVVSGSEGSSGVHLSLISILSGRVCLAASIDLRSPTPSTSAATFPSSCRDQMTEGL